MYGGGRGGKCDGFGFIVYFLYKFCFYFCFLDYERINILVAYLKVTDGGDGKKTPFCSLLVNVFPLLLYLESKDLESKFPDAAANLNFVVVAQC